LPGARTAGFSPAPNRHSERSEESLIGFFRSLFCRRCLSANPSSAFSYAVIASAAARGICFFSAAYLAVAGRRIAAMGLAAAFPPPVIPNVVRNPSYAFLSSCGSSPSPLPLRCHRERRSARDLLFPCRYLAAAGRRAGGRCLPRRSDLQSRRSSTPRSNPTKASEGQPDYSEG
jgi:hypothetical protein